MDGAGSKRFRFSGLVTKRIFLIRKVSLAWPDRFCVAAYRLEIISGALQGSGLVRDLKSNCSHQWLQGQIQDGGGGALGAEAPPFIFRPYLINMLSIIMKFCLSIII